MLRFAAEMPGPKRAPPLPCLPPGSNDVARWAHSRGFGYDARPARDWFEGWEPYDTMTSPEAYYNAVTFSLYSGTVTLVEPWYAPEDTQPLDRAVLAFVVHPGFRRRAAARGGEHFNTRVAYIESPPPPRVRVGDPIWDAHLLTFAASPSEADAAFPMSARRLLAEWAFSGHIEVRPGGLVYHHAQMKPDVGQLDAMAIGMGRLVTAFVSRA